VAQAIRAGDGDAGLGLEAVAESRGLGFVPLFEEVYWLAYKTANAQEPALQALLSGLAQPGWAHALGQFPGYREPEARAIEDFPGLLRG
jgi:putative molybdopterin biosynthesis protein